MKTQTEIKNSELPPGWRWVRLGEVCKFEYGSSLPERDRMSGSISVYGSNGMVGYHSAAITEGPTIIIGRKGSIGQVNYSEIPCWPIDTTYYIDSSKTDCNLIWLYWMLKFLRLDLLNKATGVPGLNREDAYNQIIPLPPLEVQLRIASKLQELMQEISNLQSAIQNQQSALDALPSAYLREVFESEEAKKWERKRLGDVCKLINGDAYKETDWSTSGVPIIRIQNLNDSSKPFNFWAGSLHDRVRIKTGDVLLAWSGTPGTSFGVHLWDRGEAILNQHIFRLDFQGNHLYPEWSVYAINYRLHILINNARGGVGLRHVTKKEVESLEIPVPSLIEQLHILDNLKQKMAQVDNLQSKILNQKSALDALPQAILRKAFRGEL